MVDRVKDIGGGVIDRRGQRARGRVWRVTRMDRARLEARRHAPVGPLLRRILALIVHQPSVLFLLLVMMRALNPPQLSSPCCRPYSTFGQRFMMTVRPAATALAATSSVRTPNCIHSTLAPMALASSAIAPAALALRKTSTMSIGPVSFCGMSRRLA